MSYTVETKDGIVIKDIPDDVAPDSPQLKARVESERAKLAPKSSGTPPLNLRALGDTAKDVFTGKYGRDALRSVAMGGLDLAMGAGQLVSNVVDPLIPGTSERFSGAMRDTESQYQAGRYSPNTPDVGRITGNIVSTAGAGAGAGPAAPTLVGRMAQGAKVGGVLGSVSPVDPNVQDYAGTKATHIVGGSVIGGIAPPVVEGAVRAVGATVNRLGSMARGATTNTNANNIENTIRIEFERAGADWNTVPQQVRNALIGEVQSAMNSGGQINVDAVRRIADFQRLGMTPLSGQVSRDPYLFAREQNLARMGVGAPIAERLNEQNRQLISAVNSARPQGSAPDQYAAGQRVMAGLEARDAPVRSAVGDLYRGARDNVGRAAPMDAQAFSTNANLALDEGMLGHYLPSEVRTILNDVSAGRIPFNVNTAVQMDTVLSAAQRAAGERTPQALAIGRVRDALNNAPIENSAGESAKAAFDTARQAAARRFATIERTPALDSVVGKAPEVAPEKFIEKFAIRGEVQDVANLMRNLPVDTRAEVRAGVLDFIRSKAVIGEGDAAKFTQAGLRDALRTIGDRKLDLIFAGDRAALNQLRAAARVGANVQVPPVASGVNYSGSGTAIMDFMDRMGNYPVIGALMGRPSDMIRGVQVSQSLRGAPPVTPTPPVMSDELLATLGRRGGLLAAPVAAGGILNLGR